MTDPWVDVPPPEGPPGEPATQKAARRVRVTWADTIEPEPVTWAWTDQGEGRLPAGSLSIAAGREGTGKSSFGMWMTAQITRGALPGSFHGRPRRVLYLAVEDSWKFTLVPRLMAAAADLSMVGRLEVVSTDNEMVTLSLPTDNAMLEAEIRRHGIALVVIDPLMSVMGESIDTHREREVRSALDPLAAIADRTGAVLLGIAHFSKSQGTDVASLITGSGAFKNVPRSVFGFARDEADEHGGRVMTQAKNSLGRDDLPSLSYVIESAEIPTAKGPAVTGKFSFTGQSERSVADVLRDNRGSGDPDEMSERDEAAGWLTAHLIEQGGEAAAGDVLKSGRGAGFATHVLQRARKRAGVASRKAGFGSGWVWALSPEGDTKTTKNTGHGVLSPSSSSPSSSADPPPEPVRQLHLASVSSDCCDDCGHPLTSTGKCLHCITERNNRLARGEDAS